MSVFLAAITVTAAADYSAEQIAAWARPEQRDLGDWDRGMSQRNSVVAVVEGQIAGFSDVSPDGYIDMMFVDPAHGGKGVARALLTVVENRAEEAGTPRLWANVSLTARPFFERGGFHVEAEQHPVKQGVQMTNFRMSKRLRPIL